MRILLFPPFIWHFGGNFRRLNPPSHEQLCFCWLHSDSPLSSSSRGCSPIREWHWQSLCAPLYIRCGLHRVHWLTPICRRRRSLCGDSTFTSAACLVLAFAKKQFGRR